MPQARRPHPECRIEPSGRLDRPEPESPAASGFADLPEWRLDQKVEIHR